MHEQTQMSGFHGQLFNLTSTMEAEGPLMVIRTVLSSYSKHILCPLSVRVLRSCQLHPSFAAMLLLATLDELIGREQILPTLDFSLLLPLSVCQWFFTLWVQKRQLSLVFNFVTIQKAVVSEMQNHRTAFSDVWALYGSMYFSKWRN